MALFSLGNRPLPAEEWLAQAKHVPLGQSRRVRHGSEPDSAMVVRNEAGKWSAYCHRCHLGGGVRKELVQLLPAPVQLPSRNPGRLVAPEESQLYSQIVCMLQSKGVSLVSTRYATPRLSVQDSRLVLTTRDGQIGRALSPRQSPKWWQYRDVGFMRGRPGEFRGADVVVVEDFFSALKIGFYVPRVLPVASLGTRIRPELLSRLLEARSVRMMYDGDAAGADGWAAAHRKLSLVGIPNTRLELPPGQDPKDLKPVELEALCASKRK